MDQLLKLTKTKMLGTQLFVKTCFKNPLKICKKINNVHGKIALKSRLKTIVL